MALSKSETRQAIVALSGELGIEPPANLEQIDKLDQLTPILEELQVKKAAKAPKEPEREEDDKDSGGLGSPPPAPTEPDLPAPKKLVATTYVVAEGKQVTTKRGAIGALEHVWPQDFAGGQKDLDHWVTHGAVIKTEHFE